MIRGHAPFRGCCCPDVWDAIIQSDSQVVAPKILVEVIKCKVNCIIEDHGQKLTVTVMSW